MNFEVIIPHFEVFFSLCVNPSICVSLPVLVLYLVLPFMTCRATDRYSVGDYIVTPEIKTNGVCSGQLICFK